MKVNDEYSNLISAVSLIKFLRAQVTRLVYSKAIIGMPRRGHEEDEINVSFSIDTESLAVCFIVH